MYQQGWEPQNDEVIQILQNLERKKKLRQVLQGCAFLLSVPVVANLNLGLQERVVIGVLVFLAWAVWFFFAHPRAVRRIVRRNDRSVQPPRPSQYRQQFQRNYRPAPQGQPGQYRRGQVAQGQQPQRDHPPAPQGQPGQHRQGQAAQGQEFQRNYPPTPLLEPGSESDYFGPEWEG